MTVNTGDYSKDPAREQSLIINAQEPFNAETPLNALRQSFITPTEIFYVRNHGPVPHLTEDEYRLIVEGKVENKLTLSLSEMKSKFSTITLEATLQCAGNRRNDFTRTGKPVKGVPWEAGAIGNASWTGWRLADVLELAKPTISQGHVLFEGFDGVHETENDLYTVSIPLHKVFKEQCNGDTILAYEMNGEPLTLDHGYPLRVIVPGYIGARSVKWIKRIAIQEEECDQFFQALDYKLFPSSIVGWDEATKRSKELAAIQDLNVQCVLCCPTYTASKNNPAVTAKAALDQPLILQGYAISGSGRPIERVDVSVDEGLEWHKTELEHASPQSWTLWRITLDKVKLPCNVVCRASATRNRSVLHPFGIFEE